MLAMFRVLSSSLQFSASGLERVRIMNVWLRISLPLLDMGASTSGMDARSLLWLIPRSYGDIVDSFLPPYVSMA